MNGPRATVAPLLRATGGLALMTAITVAIVIGGLVAARNASERSEEALVALTGEAMRASEAQVAAERMVALGRAYLLTTEPDLLSRAQAAEGQLERTLQALQRSLDSSGERELLEPSLTSAARYREQFERLLSRPTLGESPKALAEALRGGLLPARDQLDTDLRQLVILRQRRQAEVRGSAGEWASRVIRTMSVLGVLGATVSALLAWSVTANLKRLGTMAAVPGTNHGTAPRGPGAFEDAVQTVSLRRLATLEPPADDTAPPPTNGTNQRRTPELKWWPRN